MTYDPQCEAGCMSFTGGEKKHHRDCVHYPESLTKLWHDTEADYMARIEALEAENKRLRQRDSVLWAQEARVAESLRIKQQCDTCSYQSMDQRGPNACCPMDKCRGGMVDRAPLAKEPTDE